jgi:hypothetical protein
MEKDADLVSRITELETENSHLNNEMNTKVLDL